MLALNLRSIETQDTIKEVENALLPLYKAMAHKITWNFGVIQGDWRFDYQLINSISKDRSDLVDFMFSAYNEKLRSEQRLFVFCDLNDKDYEIKIVDADLASYSNFNKFDEEDRGALISNKDYETNIYQASNRKSALIAILKQLNDPQMTVIKPYVKEVIARFDMELNNEWKKIDDENAIKIEINMPHNNVSEWFTLPMTVKKNTELEYKFNSGIIVDYRAPFVIRPDDKPCEINKLAKALKDEKLNSIIDMFNYVQAQKPELIENKLYKYTDDNLNKVLGKLSPADIVKNMHTNTINLSDSNAENEADYFMVNNGIINLIDEDKARSIAKDREAEVINGICQLNDIKLNSDRQEQSYWI